VRFECAPAAELTLTIAARWPEREDRRHLDDAVAAAVVDVLASSDTPRLRCAVTLVAIEWTEASTLAFYCATAAAMTTLRDNHAWT